MRGDVTAAMECFVDARARATRLPDAYRWVDGYIFDALCGLGVAHDIDVTRGWIGQIAALAERTEMRELAVRAYVHRGRLGDESALAAGRALQATIDNPALDALTTSSAARG